MPLLPRFADSMVCKKCGAPAEKRMEFDKRNGRDVPSPAQCWGGVAVYECTRSAVAGDFTNGRYECGALTLDQVQRVPEADMPDRCKTGQGQL